MSIPTQNCTLLFLLRKDEILLAMKKRGFGAGKYNGVGGKIEPGETIEAALVRECQEEIRVTPTSFEKVAEHEFTSMTDTAPWFMYMHVYISHAWEGSPIETNEMAPEWFSLSSLPYKQMWEDDEYWLPLVLAGKRIKGRFSFDTQENMLSQSVIEVREFKN